jgi:hypothetical protein
VLTVLLHACPATWSSCQLCYRLLPASLVVVCLPAFQLLSQPPSGYVSSHNDIRWDMAAAQTTSDRPLLLALPLVTCSLLANRLLLPRPCATCAYPRRALRALTAVPRPARSRPYAPRPV